MIWHDHVSSIAAVVGNKLGYLFSARKYFSLSNLLTLYKAQIRPSLEYCSHIWGATTSTTLSILDAVQRRAIRLIGIGQKSSVSDSQIGPCHQSLQLTMLSGFIPRDTMSAGLS
nr:unnamed protein product [Callosobruchus chinensis]